MTPFYSILIILACYGIGCVTAAYYIVRWKSGQDLRELGTGTLGARNAGRVLGRKGYLLVSLLDIAKGAGAFALAKGCGLQGVWLVAAGLAVVAGHLWPAHLRFRGGKGIATGYGVIAMCVPLIGLLMWIFLFAGRALLRRWTLAGIFAFLAAGASTALIFLHPYEGRGWALHYDETQVTLVSSLALLVLWTHRSNLRESPRNSTDTGR